MPRPLFTANRQSANTLIWRRFDPFRPYRLPAWLIAPSPALTAKASTLTTVRAAYACLFLLTLLGAHLTNAACWITLATVNIVARLLPAEWHTRPIMPAPESTATAMPARR